MKTGVVITVLYPKTGRRTTHWFADNERYDLFLLLCKGEVLSIEDCTLEEYEDMYV